MRKMSATRAEILLFIFVEDGKVSKRDIARHIGCKSDNTVVKHIAGLIKSGYIQHQTYSRYYHVTDQGVQALEKISNGEKVYN